MARRDHRVGLKTTTISVKLAAPELEALDLARKHEQSVFGGYRTYYETRGDALRRLIGEAEERRLDVLKLNDQRQVTLTEAIAATSGKTASSPAAATPAGKTRRRRAGSRRPVRPAGKTARGGRKARIRR